jgi:Cys-tRNA(Pro)/Cys-tRNA(Cys) deacylase
MIANNITRMLQAHKIAFTAYETPAEKLGAEETARILDIPLDQVFKTIVILRERGKPILAVIPGDREADLKAVASAAGEKKVRLPTQNEAEKLTGLQAGGISPLALINKGFQVLIDNHALDFDQIHISGGQRGLNIRMGVQDLISLTKARTARMASGPSVGQD